MNRTIYQVCHTFQQKKLWNYGYNTWLIVTKHFPFIQLLQIKNKLIYLQQNQNMKLKFSMVKGDKLSRVLYKCIAKFCLCRCFMKISL